MAVYGCVGVRRVRMSEDEYYIVKVKTKRQKLPPKTTEISHLLKEKIKKFGV